MVGEGGGGRRILGDRYTRFHVLRKGGSLSETKTERGGDEFHARDSWHDSFSFRNMGPSKRV